jgi:hypothetical protein
MSEPPRCDPGVSLRRAHTLVVRCRTLHSLTFTPSLFAHVHPLVVCSVMSAGSMRRLASAPLKRCAQPTRPSHTLCPGKPAPSMGQDAMHPGRDFVPQRPGGTRASRRGVGRPDVQPCEVRRYGPTTVVDASFAEHVPSPARSISTCSWSISCVFFCTVHRVWYSRCCMPLIVAVISGRLGIELAGALCESHVVDNMLCGVRLMLYGCAGSRIHCRDHADPRGFVGRREAALGRRPAHLAPRPARRSAAGCFVPVCASPRHPEAPWRHARQSRARSPCVGDTTTACTTQRARTTVHRCKPGIDAALDAALDAAR